MRAIRLLSFPKNQRPNRSHVPPGLVLIESRPEVLVLAIRRAVVVADADVKTDFITWLDDRIFHTFFQKTLDFSA